MHPARRIAFRLPAVLSALLLFLLAASAPGARAQGVVLTLSPQVVSQGKPVTATVLLAAGTRGMVRLLDNGQPIAIAPVTADGSATFGLGQLVAGSHSLSAVLYSDAAASGFPVATSNAAPVLVTAPVSSFRLLATPGTALAGEPIAVAAAGLPADATGTVHYFDNGRELLAMPLGTRLSRYESFGDSLTRGAGVPGPEYAYPAMLGALLGLPTVNDAHSGFYACDMLARTILPFSQAATARDLPLLSLMVGTNDARTYPVTPEHDAAFRACHTAALAWLGVPRENKVVAGDAAVSAPTGTWTLNAGEALDQNAHTFFNTSSGDGTLRFLLTTSGTAPIYLWYVQHPTLAGSFAVSLDGVPTGTVYQTLAAPGTLFTPAIALGRIEASAGTHTLEIKVLSGQVGVLGVGSPVEPASPHPPVLVGDVPHSRQGDGPMTEALLAHYAHLIAQDAALLTRDGLDLRLVSTQADLLGLPGEMSDPLHPNDLGEANLARAFARVLREPAATLAAPATLAIAAPGTHLLTATYSGDAHYPASAAAEPVTLTLAENASTTTLATSQAAVLRGQGITLTGSVVPPSATGSLRFLELSRTGQQMLGEVTLDGTSGIATLPITLAAGPHTLMTLFTSDLWRASSASGTVAVQVNVSNEPTTTTLAAEAQTAPHGTWARLSAQVANTAGIATDGTLLLSDNGTPLGSVPLDASGTARFDTALLPGGSHTFSASFVSNPRFMASTAKAALTVPFEISSIDLQTAQTRYNTDQPIIMVATATPSTATGTLYFLDGERTLGTQPIQGGTASFTVTGLAVGVHVLHVAYQGDAFLSGSQSSPLPVQVGRTATALALAPLPATATYGTLGSLVATLTPTGAVGPITLTDTTSVNGQPTSTVLGKLSPVGGKVAVPLAGLAVGVHTLTASYGGDDNYLPATGSATVEVTAISTRATLTASAASVELGAPVTLTARVEPAGSARDGRISFRDGASGTELAQVTAASGTATWSSSTWTRGTHTLTAVYLGDSSGAPSTSPAVTLEVVRQSSTLALAPLLARMSTGTPLQLSATLVPASATGLVTFLNANGTAAGQAMLQNGSASLSLPSLPAGTASFSASYAGDDRTAPAISAAVGTVVERQVSSLVLSGLAASMPYASASSLRIAISPAAATGDLVVSEGGSTLGVVPIVAGGGTLTLPRLSVGPHTLAVRFAGDAVYTDASASTSTVVTPATSSTSLALAQTQVPAAGQVVFNVRVSTNTPYTPGGQVRIEAGGRTVAQAPLTGGTAGVAYATVSAPAAQLGLGSFAAVAYYAGDAGSAGSDTLAQPVPFTVVATPVVVGMALSARAVPVGVPVTLTADVSSPVAMPAGQVVFAANGRDLGASAVDAAGHAALAPASLPLGSYTVTAHFVPTGTFAAADALPETVAVTLPIALTLASASVAATPGSTHDVAMTITPLSGFAGALGSTCTTSATYVGCTLDAPSTAGGQPARATLHIRVSKDRITTAHLGIVPGTAGGSALALTLPLLLRFRRRLRTTARLPRMLVLALSVGLLGSAACALTGCAEGGNFFDIPPGTETVQVSVRAGGSTVAARVAVVIAR